MTRLTAVQARAAADAYGWEVMSQDRNGFMATSGQWRLNVVFEDDGAFRHASAKQGANGFEEFVPESMVVGRFAQHGRAPERPASSEEKTA